MSCCWMDSGVHDGVMAAERSRDLVRLLQASPSLELDSFMQCASYL